MPAAQYLVFRSGESECALPLASIREISRYHVLASRDEHGLLRGARINARGRIANVELDGRTELDNPVTCIVAELTPGTFTAYVADEIVGAKEGRGAARLLADMRSTPAA